MQSGSTSANNEVVLRRVLSIFITYAILSFFRGTTGGLYEFSLLLKQSHNCQIDIVLWKILLSWVTVALF